MRKPELRQVRDFVVGSLAALADPDQVPNPYEAEVMVSVLLGRMAEVGASASVIGAVLLDVVDELVRRRDDHAYPALRVLAVLGPDEVRAYASAAADRVVAEAGTDGVFMPPWVDDLGRVATGTCWVAEDPFGESTVLSCDFSYPGGTSPHIVWTAIDATWHGVSAYLSVGDDGPDAALALMKQNAKEIGATPRKISAEEAGALLLPALEAFERYGMPPEEAIRDRSDEDDLSMALSGLALARARAAVLLGPGGKAPVPEDLAGRWTPAERKALADEFLASPQARDLKDLASRTMPLMIISLCVQVGRDPRITGPDLLRRLLWDCLPHTLIGPDRFGDVVPDVLEAWTDWRAEQNGLDGKTRTKLLVDLQKLVPRFLIKWRDPNTQPLRRYVQDLPEEVSCDGRLQQPAVDRRVFAVPEPHNRPSGISLSSSGKAEDSASLDAASARDRSLITAQYANSRGVPQRQFGSYVAVVEQLWADSPASVWETARRLRDAGMSRDAIMKRLVRDYEQEGNGA